VRPFLEKISEEILDLEDKSSLLVLLPNKRAAQTVKEHLSKKTRGPGWLPRFNTIEELVSTYGGMERARPVELYIEFYRSQLHELQDKAYDLAACMEWAPIFLKDFNDIDLGLTNPDEIYQHLYELKQVDHWSPERIESFEGEFLALWKSVPGIYRELNTRLKKRNRYYRGRMLRDFTENNLEGLKRAGFKTIFLGGFNALTPVEELIIKQLDQYFDLRKYWQLQSFHQSSIQEAGNYLTKIYKDDPKKFNWIYDDIYSKEYSIASIESPGTSEMLDACAYNIEIGLNKTENEQVTIVLPDESLLLPLISRLKYPFTSTVGIPISELPIAEFTMRMMEFIECRSSAAAALSTEFARKYDKEVSSLFVSIDKIRSNSILLKIEVLRNFFSSLKEESKDYLSQSALLKMIELLNVLIGILKERNSSFDAISPLLNSLFIGAEVLIPEHKDARVNILGILETRLQVYDNLHILAVEEGVLPNTGTSMSFLPQFLRRTFGLSLDAHSNSVQSYNFMNLLANSSKIFLYHRSGNDGIGFKERSRYIEQIYSEWKEVNPKIDFKKLETFSNAHSFDSHHYAIEKTTEVEDKILNYLKHSGLSASAMNNFLSSPMQFYLNNVLGIREQQSNELLTDESTFGSLVHSILEKEYAPLKGAELNIQILDEIKERIRSIEPADYQEHFTDDKHPHLSLAAAKKYCLKWIRQERIDLKENGARIEILSLESFHYSSIEVNGITIKLKGIIDRVDRRNGQIRLLDYKTGHVPHRLIKKGATGLEIFEEPKVIQLFFYDLLINKEVSNAHLGLVPLKNIKPDPVFIDSEVLFENRDLFKGFLEKLLVDIMDKNTTLFQPDDFKYKFVE
jgi:ATP-dependent helicase/nuclease subunit B